MVGLNTTRWRKMRIVLDFSAVRTPGTLTYAAGFLQAVARIADGHRILALVSDSLWRLRSSMSLAPLVVRQVPWSRSGSVRLVWELFGLPWLLRREITDVLFAPFGVSAPWTSCPVVLAVRDPGPHLGEQDGGPWRERVLNRVRRKVTELAARSASFVVFPSVTAAEEVGASIGVQQGKRRVIYHGTDHHRWHSPTDTEPIVRGLQIEPRHYVLYVSSLYRKKHPETLIEAFWSWCKQSGRRDFRLVIAGNAPDRSFAKYLDRLMLDLAVRRQVLMLGTLSRDLLAALYQNAAVFVMPSSLETFGQPYVEAMACGVPLICADTRVAREICADCAAYFPVGDASRLAEHLARVIEGPSGEFEQKVARGRERAAQFSWDREARETFALLEEAVGEPRSAKAGGGLR